MGPAPVLHKMSPPSTLLFPALAPPPLLCPFNCLLLSPPAPSNTQTLKRLGHRRREADRKKVDHRCHRSGFQPQLCHLQAKVRFVPQASAFKSIKWECWQLLQPRVGAKINQGAIRQTPSVSSSQILFLSSFPSWFPQERLFIASPNVENSIGRKFYW